MTTRFPVAHFYRLWQSLVFAALLAAVTVPARAVVYFVSPAGSNSNNGRAWTRAKKTIQAAINSASQGDQIWVKKGTYLEYPVLAPKLSIYGGFAGTETTRFQRNWVTNPTI